jgi:hypothetical protein
LEIQNLDPDENMFFETFASQRSSLLWNLPNIHTSIAIFCFRRMNTGSFRANFCYCT